MTDLNKEDATALKDMKSFEKWRKSLQYITGLGMTEQEKNEFKKKLDQELEEYQCKTCEVWKENLIKNSKP
jgi:inner membrane protease ATP23